VRPIKLQIEGFTAYKSSNFIDFSEAQFLVLSGPNGAGKSSILDAIIFALFGNIPRMKGKQIKEFISQGKDKFQIIFQFLLNDKMYRVERAYPLKGTPSVRLQAQENGSWKTITDKVSETNERIEGLLRLGYDAFIKSVILPQNLFDQFLKGDKEKRREVLTEILNLDLFEKISKLAGEKVSSFKIQIQQKEEALLEMNQQVSPESAGALQQKLEGDQKEKQEVSSNRAVLEAKKQELLRLGELIQEKEKLKKEESSLLLEKEKWAEQEKKLSVLKSLLPFATDLTLLKEKKEQNSRLRIDLDRHEASRKELEQTFLTTGKELKIIEQEEQFKVLPLKERLNLLQGFKELATVLDKNQKEKKELKIEFERISSALDSFELEQKKVLNQKEELEQQISKQQEIEKPLEKSQARFSIYTEILESLKEMGTLEQDTPKIEKEKEDSAKELAEVVKERSILESQKNAFEQKLLLLEAEVEEIKIHNLSTQLQGSLKIGEPCPVCLQTVNQLPSPGQLSPTSAEHELKKIELKTLKNQREKLLQKKAGLEEAESRLKKEIEKKNHDLTERKEKKLFLEKELSNRLELPQENLLTKAREEYKTLKDKDKDHKNVQQELKRLTSGLQALTAEIQTQEQNTSQSRQRKAVIFDRITKLESDIHHQEEKMIAAGLRDFSLKGVEESASRLEEEIKLFQKKKEQKSHLLEETKGRLKTVLQQEEHLKNKAAEESTTLENLEKTLQNKLLDLGFQSIENLPEIDLPKIAKIEEGLKQYQLNLRLNSEKLKETTARIADRPYSSDEVVQIENEIQKCRTQEEFLLAEIGKTLHQIQELDKIKERIGLLVEEIRSLKSKETLYATIHQDLRKDKLPDYLFSSVLDTILKEAGEKFFELSGKRYRLALEGNGEIQALDGWNQDEARSVTSLSGGESFAASLSAALALSEYLQGRQRIQSLFIDEGFGNLDRETRDKVAEILSSLQTGDRMVGIVTHIEELAELFPHRIVVEKYPEGSRILQNF
jgi:exonuclease SbcC